MSKQETKKGIVMKDAVKNLKKYRAPVLLNNKANEENEYGRQY